MIKNAVKALALTIGFSVLGYTFCTLDSQSKDVPTEKRFLVPGSIQIVQVGKLADGRTVVVAKGKQYGAESTIVLPKTVSLPVWRGEKTLEITERKFITTSPDGKIRMSAAYGYQFK